MQALQALLDTLTTRHDEINRGPIAGEPHPVIKEADSDLLQGAADVLRYWADLRRHDLRGDSEQIMAGIVQAEMYDCLRWRIEAELRRRMPSAVAA